MLPLLCFEGKYCSGTEYYSLNIVCNNACGHVNLRKMKCRRSLVVWCQKRSIPPSRMVIWLAAPSPLTFQSSFIPPWEVGVASWLVRLTPIRSKQSRFESWLGTLCCVLGQDTLLLQCLSPPRCINGYQRT